MVASVLLSASASTVAPLQPGVQGVVPSERLDAFQDSMARAGDASKAIEGAQQPTAVSETGQVDLDAQSRARRGLGLDGPEAVVKPAPGQGGEMILEGLQKLRGVFDAREARLGEVMSSSGTDARSLMAMQMEMTNFTLLVDISSKLTGKTTAAFDTLMKGQ